VTLSQVSISGYVDLACSSSDGIDSIRETIQSAEEDLTLPEDVTLEIMYVGSPEYLLKIVAPNYKLAESLLETYSNHLIETITQKGGTGSFHRDRHRDDDA